MSQEIAKLLINIKSVKFSFSSAVAGPKIFVHPLLYFGNVKLISSYINISELSIR